MPQFFTVTHSLLQFHEILQSKSTFPNSPIDLRLLFYNIYAAYSLCNSITYHKRWHSKENKVMSLARPLHLTYYCSYSLCFNIKIAEYKPILVTSSVTIFCKWIHPCKFQVHTVSEIKGNGETTWTFTIILKRFHFKATSTSFFNLFVFNRCRYSLYHTCEHYKISLSYM